MEASLCSSLVKTCRNLKPSRFNQQRLKICNLILLHPAARLRFLPDRKSAGHVTTAELGSNLRLIV